MKTKLLALALLASATAALADKAGDTAMLKLANSSGCMSCHHVEPTAKSREGMAPIGPAWREVAAKYRGDKGAQAKLVQAVYAGSNPYDSHWKDKVAGLAMPPNAVRIPESEVKKLVKWILALDVVKKG